jgi:hypothetical protein
MLAPTVLAALAAGWRPPCARRGHARPAGAGAAGDAISSGAGGEPRAAGGAPQPPPPQPLALLAPGARGALSRHSWSNPALAASPFYQLLDAADLADLEAGEGALLDDPKASAAGGGGGPDEQQQSAFGSGGKAGGAAAARGFGARQQGRRGGAAAAAARLKPWQPCPCGSGQAYKVRAGRRWAGAGRASLTRPRPATGRGAAVARGSAHVNASPASAPANPLAPCLPPPGCCPSPPNPRPPLPQSCCEPYHSGAAHPPIAPDLVRARVSALALGLSPFLASICHPDGAAPAGLGRILGGSRALLARRLRREASLHARLGLRPLAMAHCEGDEPGTWVVGYVLEAAAGGELVEGHRWTVLELCKRAGACGGPDGSPGGAAEEKGGAAAGRWLWFGPTRAFPQRHDASGLIEMIQEHDPAALGGRGGGGDAARGGLAGRRRMFLQGPRPRLDGGGGGGGWFLDLLSPEAVVAAAEAALGGAAAGAAAAGAPRRARGGGGGGGTAAARAARRAGAAAVAEVAAAAAARGEDGWFEMDSYLAALEAQKALAPVQARAGGGGGGGAR